MTLSKVTVCEFVPLLRVQIAKAVELLASGRFEDVEQLAVPNGCNAKALKEEMEGYPAVFSKSLLFTEFSINIDGGAQFDEAGRLNSVDNDLLKCCVEVVTDGNQNVRFVDADCLLADKDGYATDLSLRLRLMGLNANDKFAHLFVEVM